MCISDGYRGFVVGIFVAGVILGFGAIQPPNPTLSPLTSPMWIMILDFVIAGIMSGMYMIFHDKV